MNSYEANQLIRDAAAMFVGPEYQHVRAFLYAADDGREYRLSTEYRSGRGRKLTLTYRRTKKEVVNGREVFFMPKKVFTIPIKRDDTPETLLMRMRVRDMEVRLGGRNPYR